MEVSTKVGSQDDYDERRSLVQNAKDAALLPLRIATSPPLLRTYLRTILLLITSTLLFAFAVIAYTSFYYTYIPIRGISLPIYLQFDHGSTPFPFSDARSSLAPGAQKWPHAITGVQGLVNRQKYDVAVEMTVPRSKANLQAGNWMLDLSIRGPPPVGGLKGLLGWDDEEDTPSADFPAGSDAETARTVLGNKPPVLAHSRRPAILTYRSWPTEHLYRLLRLPLYLTGFGTESETLKVSMLEAAYFPSTVPASIRLELRSRAPLEVYSVQVHIRAKLEGLRWLMYTHRLASAVVFVLLFWGTEVGVLLVTWGLATMLFGSSHSKSHQEDGDTDSVQDGKMKKDLDGASEPATPLSDTSHTFPSLTGHAPLRYASSSDALKTKEEAGEQRLEDIPLKEDAEADDEDDDFVLESPMPRDGVGFTDSGVGTGVDSERDRERERVRRRGSAKGRKEER